MTSKKPVSASLQIDRGLYIIRGRVYDPRENRVRQRSKSTGLKAKNHTKRQALLIMKDVVAQWECEANAEVFDYDPFFWEYIEKWIDKKRLSLKANSVKSYEDYAKVHILPKLGDLKIRDMTLKHLQIFYNDLLKNISVNSAKKVHVVISGALLDAVRDNIIPVNFADYVEFPKAKPFEGHTYTPEQVSKLLEAVKAEGEPIRAAVTLAVCYGLRRSEVCGLRWIDIDFDEKVLRVRNTVVQNGTLKIEAQQTKTSKSRRTIALIEATIPYLKELKQLQESNGLKLDKVVAWLNGQPLRPDYLTAKTRKLMEKYGLQRIRLHDLRHTAASLLATKATAKQVQAFLGHSDIGTTLNIYVHSFDESRKETSNIMNSILENSVLCSEKCSESD